MTETTYDGPPGPDGPSEDELRELMLRMRATPAAELVTELFSTLLSTAQVKLGRRDARLFIDLCAQALEYAGPHLPAELTRQVESALGQLRLAQVTAEGQVAESGEPEPHDLDHLPTPPRPPAAGAPEPSAPAPAASRLWVPGSNVRRQ